MAATPEEPVLAPHSSQALMDRISSTLSPRAVSCPAARQSCRPDGSCAAYGISSPRLIEAFVAERYCTSSRLRVQQERTEHAPHL